MPEPSGSHENSGSIASLGDYAMATFEVLEQEGMHFVHITINNETIQAEAGALCTMRGNIVMDVKLPSLGRIFKSYISEEAHLRATYTGTGKIILESSFGGFHIFLIAGETWILESGCYLASEGSLSLGGVRERMWTSLWAGEGLIDWQTKVSGHGKVVVASAGPVDEVTLTKDERYVANGRYIIGRTADTTYSIGRPTKTMLGAYLSGEGYCRTYLGPGRLLVSSVPYWRYRVFGPRPTHAAGSMLAA
jgi:uncharacterized protein (AIM24 family)